MDSQDLCDYTADKETIKDVPIIECSNTETKDKIIRKESTAMLEDVMEILQKPPPQGPCQILTLIPKVYLPQSMTMIKG